MDLEGTDPATACSEVAPVSFELSEALEAILDELDEISPFFSDSTETIFLRVTDGADLEVSVRDRVVEAGVVRLLDVDVVLEGVGSTLSGPPAPTAPSLSSTRVRSITSDVFAVDLLREVVREVTAEVVIDEGMVRVAAGVRVVLGVRVAISEGRLVGLSLLERRLPTH